MKESEYSSIEHHEWWLNMELAVQQFNQDNGTNFEPFDMTVAYINQEQI